MQCCACSPARPHAAAVRLRLVRCSAQTPAQRYEALLSAASPPLFLAPMEGLGDRAFRRSLSQTTGGLDEACTEFIRIPGVAPPLEAHLRKSAARLTGAAYDCRELGDTPLAAQLMGSDAGFLAAATAHLAGTLGAQRIDLNCGCPANTVTGRGAGSSLLRETALLHACVRAMADAAAAHGAVVSVKLRAGFNDTSDFERNLAAVVDAGAALVTLHPRTRLQGYSGAADWDLIRRAVRLSRVPVVGNGDVTSACRARELHALSGCAGIMVGRGAAQDPLIFRRIRAAFGRGPAVDPGSEAASIEAFVRSYYQELTRAPLPRSAKAAGGRTETETSRFRLGKLKQLSNYLLRADSRMAPTLAAVLRAPPDTDSDVVLERVVHCVRDFWAGPPQALLVDTFSSRNAYDGPTQRAIPEQAGCCL